MKKEITEDNFDEVFKPQINHFERAKQPVSVADEDVCSFNGQMYETFGEELDYVFNLAKTTKREFGQLLKVMTTQCFIVQDFTT